MTLTRVLTIGAGLTAGLLSSAIAIAQSGPPAPPVAAEPPPSLEKRCIVDVSGFTHKGKAINFVVQLTNTCDVRLKCVVNAYVISAFGARQGHKALILAAKSKGTGSKQSMTFKVKADSGATYRAHTCTEI